jgi:hypothetical protein
MRSLLPLVCIAGTMALACGDPGEPTPPVDQGSPEQPEPPPDGPMPPAEPGPAPEPESAPLPMVPPADAGGWADPGPAQPGDPCPADMAHVPAGAFVSGATGEQANINLDWPDPGFGPRPRRSRQTGAYCVDLYEWPNVPGEKPRVWVGWAEAKEACASRGRRLCTEDEWARACGGDQGWLFPYGDTHEPGRCNDAVDPVGDDTKKTGAGALPGCVSPFGAFDMDGNVSEWVDAAHEVDPERGRVVRGGTMWVAVYGHGCMSRHFHHEGGPTHSDDGFRCCADPLAP